MGEASVQAWKIIREKMKYWSKVLSDDAMLGVLDSTLDIFDWLSFFSDWQLSDTLFSSLVSYFLLDINLKDIAPINLDFEVELPSLDEFLRGVLIKLLKIDITILAPDLLKAIETPSLFLESEYAENLESTRLRKGVYGVTYFDHSYYDPVPVREFFRSTLYAFMKKRGEWRSARDKVEAIASTLNIHPELARMLYNRLSAITMVKERALTWDYGWWDRTYWAEEGSGGRIQFYTYEGTLVTMPYEDLIDYQAGGFWDDAAWDYFYWTEEPPKAVHPYRLDKYRITVLQDRFWSNFRDRITTTAMAVANYQTREEREKWWRSERTDIYGFTMSQRMQIETVVDHLVRSMRPGIDAVRLRLYKTAALELYADLAGIHRWGQEAVQSMSEEQRRTFWIERWVKAGLDRDVLAAVYDRVRGLIKTLVSRRQRQRLRFLRSRLRVGG